MNLLVFDIDDTILPRGDREIPSLVVETINEVLKKGDAICLASGRPFLGIKQFLDVFCDGKKFAISSNGAALYDSNGNLITEKVLKPIDLYYLHNKYQEHKEITIYGYDDQNGLLIFNNDKWINREINVNRINHVLDFSKNDYSKENIKVYKVMFAADKEYSHLFTLGEEDLKKYSATRSTNNYYEVLNKNASKETMIESLGKFLDVSNKDIYTFGDNDNDIKMLEKYNGVALGNALDACKKVAKYTTKDVKENGVAYAIKNMVAFLFCR